MNLPVDFDRMDRYLQEEWRPIPEGSSPAFERAPERPVRVWGPVGDLHRPRRRHIVSKLGEKLL